MKALGQAWLLEDVKNLRLELGLELGDANAYPRFRGVKEESVDNQPSSRVSWHTISSAIGIVQCLGPIYQVIANDIDGVKTATNNILAMVHTDISSIDFSEFLPNYMNVLTGSWVNILRCLANSATAIGLSYVTHNLVISPIRNTLAIGPNNGDTWAAFFAREGAAVATSQVARTSLDIIAPYTNRATNAIDRMFAKIETLLKRFPIFRASMNRTLVELSANLIRLLEVRDLRRQLQVPIHYTTSYLTAALQRVPMGPRNIADYQLQRNLQMLDHLTKHPGQKYSETKGPATPIKDHFPAWESDSRFRELMQAHSSSVDPIVVTDLIAFLNDPSITRFDGQVVYPNMFRGYGVALRRSDWSNPNAIQYEITRANAASLSEVAAGEDPDPRGRGVYMEIQRPGELDKLSDVWNNIVRSCCTLKALPRY